MNTPTFYAPGFELAAHSTSARQTAFNRLVSKCNAQGIVCERFGRRIELTTPDGGTTAVCHSVTDAWAEYHNDPAFFALPLRRG